MMGIKEEVLIRLREKYPAGTRIGLIEMDDCQAPPVGTLGTVTEVDSCYLWGRYG